MAKKVTVEAEIKVKGGKEVEESTEKFVSFRKQARAAEIALQELSDQGITSGKKFEQFKKDLDDAQDGIKKAAFAGAQLEDKLSAMPGPIGAVGRAFGSAKEAVETFGKKIAIALGVVGLIVGAFMAMKESLSRTEEGTKKLTQITEAFEKIMNGLFAVIEPIAMALADLAVKLLSNKSVMEGISTTVGVLTGVFTGLLGSIKSVGKFIYDILITNFKTLIDVAKGAGEVIEGVFTFDWDKIKSGADKAFTAVTDGVKSQISNAKELGKGIATAVSDGFTAGSKSFTEGSKRLTEAEREALKKKKAEDAAKLAADDAKQKAIDDAKNLADANKVLDDAYLTSLDERNKEIYKRGQKLNEDMLALSKAGFTDMTAVKESYNRDVAAIDKKYDDEAAQKEADKKKKAEDDAQKAADDAQKAADEKLGRDNSLLESSANLAQKEFDLKRANNEATFQDQRDTFEKIRAAGHEAMAANVAAGKANADDLTAYEKETATMRIQNKKDEEAVNLQAVSGALDAVASLVDEGSTAGKAISIAKAIINTYQGATMALGAYPPPFNFIAAAATVAAGFMNVNKIINTKVPSIKPGGGDVASSGAAAPSYSGAPPAMAIPTVQTSGGNNPATQIGQTIQDTQNKNPIRAYVVSGEISNQQSLDRKTNRSATFALG